MLLIDFFRKAPPTPSVLNIRLGLVLFLYPFAKKNFLLTVVFLSALTIFSKDNHSILPTNKKTEINNIKLNPESEQQILVQRAELAEQNLITQKHYYQLFGLIALALIFGCIGYMFFYQQKLKNQQFQKENELKDALLKVETQSRLQEQRLSISQDLHDTIGAQLTFIISSIDNLKYGFDIQDEKLNHKLNSISDFTSDTIYELRDTIWAMNKKEITLEDLQSRISNYIDKAHLFDGKINFSFNIPSNVNLNRTFSSEEGINIYRIIRESIHNSLKHANPSQIYVKVSQNDRNLQVQVVDNGKGFNMDKVEKGNGLMNMQKRINEIGGQLHIDSQKNSGTKVSLLLPK